MAAHRHAVLITRPAPDAAATARRVEALGWAPVLAPLLTITPSPLAPNEPVDGLVVTSGNALPSLHAYRGVRLLAVGDATAARARSAGFEDVTSASGDAQALAHAAPAVFAPGSTLLFATAENEGLALAAALARAGYTVRRRTAYAVHPAAALPAAARDAIASGNLHAALFLSARTARVFAGLLDPALRPHLAGIEALAIGQPAAEHLTPLPWRRVRVSLAPTLDQVLALL